MSKGILVGDSLNFRIRSVTMFLCSCLEEGIHLHYVFSFYQATILMIRNKLRNNGFIGAKVQ
jgi:hypothetical protein